MNKTNRVLTHVVTKILYTVILLYIVLFNPKRLSHQIISSAKIIPFKNTITMITNPAPGADWKYWWEFWLNLLGNIALFMPFGFWLYGSAISGKKNKVLVTVALSLLVSFTIECCQWKFRLGVFDVDDIILNATSAYLGILCFKIYEKKFLVGK